MSSFEFPHISSSDKYPTNLMGSLGSLGIEWGYKVRPSLKSSDLDEEKEGSSKDKEGEAEGSEGDITSAEGGEEEEPPGLSQFCIDEVTMPLLLFREKLVVLEQTGGPELGRFNISVESTVDGQFLVHLSGRALLDGVHSGMSATARVDRGLNTIEEKRYEFSREEGSIQQKHLYIAQDVDNLDGHYVHIAVTSMANGYSDRRMQDVPYSTVKNLLSEGACMLLMRFMALSGYTGILELPSVLNNGALCDNIFTCNGPLTRRINNQQMQVYEIRRIVPDASGENQTLRSMLTTAGQLLEYVWLNGPYMMSVSHLVNLDSSMPVGERDLVEPLIHRWATDIQAISLFLDRKDQRIANHKSYLLDHPEIQMLISDFIQALLLMKPENTLDFAISHFTAFYSDESDDEVSEDKTLSKDKFRF